MEKDSVERIQRSVQTITKQLDRLGEFDIARRIHNRRMERIRLPGLKYYDEDDNSTKGRPTITSLLLPGNLNKKDLEVLLRMNSFYNNRFAKVMEDYSNALFFIEQLGLMQDMIDGKTITRDLIDDKTFEQLMIKHRTLSLITKSYYMSEEDIDEKEFADEVEKTWGDQYEKYFDEKLPEQDNALMGDVLFLNMLYNPLFLSYRFKNRAMKVDYAYMHFQSLENPETPLNFGVVIDDEHTPEKIVKSKNILISSDGGTNLPNRLHTIKREFQEFVKAYTGKSLVRIYEGFNDFYAAGEYVSSQMLLPSDRVHEKYLKDLVSGKLAKKGDTISKVMPTNANFVNHIQECMDKSKIKRRPVRYIDLSTGEIYVQKEKGELVSQEEFEKTGEEHE